MSDMEGVGNERSLLYTSKHTLYVFHICDNRIKGIIHIEIKILNLMSFLTRPNLTFLHGKQKENI